MDTDSQNSELEHRQPWDYITGPPTGYGLIAYEMVGIGSRMSTGTHNSGGPGSRPTSKDGNKNIWSSMLDSVASGKRLPEKNMIVLGTVLSHVLSS